VRLLMAIHNAYTDTASGAARSMRTIVEWLAAAGHECRVLCTARFDARPPDSLDGHLSSLGVRAEAAAAPRRLIRSGSAARPVRSFELNGIPVTMVFTRHNDWQRPDRDETEQLVNLCRRILRDFQPQVVLSYGPHAAVQEMLRLARRHGARTVFSVRNYGYEDRRWFAHADSVLACSPFLARYYAARAGIQCTGIPSPIRWSDVLAPEESRTFVTFVNPSLEKGAALFARLADMLGSRRPDIPVLVVQSAADVSSLNSIPGIDFSRYPQIMAAPPVPRPADFFELTRILLVPSVFQEPFGRVAAEALINGVPPVVSDRGALPETVDGAGAVLRLPEWLTPSSLQIPDEQEARPWFEAVCSLWDDAELYARQSAGARAAASRLYAEEPLRARYLEYFDSVAGR